MRRKYVIKQILRMRVFFSSKLSVDMLLFNKGLTNMESLNVSTGQIVNTSRSSSHYSVKEIVFLNFVSSPVVTNMHFKTPL